jgi:hypothetical protein
MLIKRCPDLEELIFDGYSPSEPVDAHRLTRGRWPKLRKLVLGDIVTDWHPMLNSATTRSFITFLENHRELEALHLYGRQPSVGAPIILEALHPDTLSKVVEFGGSLEQFQAFQHKSRIQRLCVPDAIPLRESTPVTISGILSIASHLTSLTISFMHLTGYDNGSIIRCIASSCPLLEHLDFTCACRASFKFVRAYYTKKKDNYLTYNIQDNFCRSIRPLTRLRRLNLRIVKVRDEDSLLACGVHLVHTNPRLTEFTISFLKGHPTIPTRACPPSVVHTARFDLTTDQHSHPVSLRVIEHEKPLFTWFRQRRRVYVIDLRPPGYPGVRKPGVFSLLVDSSPAGREARLLILCVTLLAAATGGYLANFTHRTLY